MNRSIPSHAACSLLLAAALAVPAPALPAGTAAPEGDQQVSVVDRAYMASKIYASIQLYFAHFQAVPELDLDAAYRAYLAEALTAPDRRSFSLASKAFVARLGNGHSD
jgi:carboxyl-terminal processing protease